MYSIGKGVEKDFSKAANWFQLSAKQDNPQAQSYLGVLYANGLGVEKNSVKAETLFRLAANQGHGDKRHSFEQELAKDKNF